MSDARRKGGRMMKTKNAAQESIPPLPKIYGNTQICTQFAQSMHRNRVAHGFLIWGEQGLGKKTLAQHMAASLFCADEKKPCGVCKSCRMIRRGIHPDFCTAEHSGKRGGFSVDTVRQICRDLATPPNEGSIKCYLFCDCDAMDARTQNLLLKAVEEPPDYVYFFFTAESPAALLPTIRSRVISLAATPLTEQQCRAALRERDDTPENNDAAMEAFHGNLGKCIDF